jgi:transposase-like protein
MSMVSHLHHLFNPETCQAYIHMLRWKDRPLQCPRCQSLNVGPWGTYHAQPGLRRYRCKGKDCKRTFNDLTGTLLDTTWKVSCNLLNLRKQFTEGLFRAVFVSP